MSFNDTILTDKLRKLTSTQQSIQTLSHWVTYHRKHHLEIVRIWQREIANASSPGHAVALLHLANDVMQTSRKKTIDFVTAFGDVMGDVFRTTISRLPQTPGHTRDLTHLIDIWEERKVLSPQLCRNLRKYLPTSPSPSHPPSSSSSRSHPPGAGSPAGEDPSTFGAGAEDMVACDRHWRQYRKACERTKRIPPTPLTTDLPSIEEMDKMTLEALRENFGNVEHQLKAAQEEDVLVKAAMADKLAFFQFLDATFFATLKTEVRDDQQRIAALEGYLSKAKIVANYVASRIGHHGPRRDPAPAKPPQATRPVADPRPQPPALSPSPTPEDGSSSAGPTLREQALASHDTGNGPRDPKRRRVEDGPLGGVGGGGLNLNGFLEDFTRKFTQDRAPSPPPPRD